MREAALRMNALVNNLLDMARLEAGAVQLNRQWQPLEEVVGSALAVRAPVLPGRPCAGRPRRRPAAGAPRRGADRARAVQPAGERRQVHPAGYGRSTIDARATSDAVVLTVDDHGPGLPRGKEEAIFQKFERGTKESATPGVGLGAGDLPRHRRGARRHDHARDARPVAARASPFDCRAASRRTMMAAQLNEHPTARRRR